MFGNLGNDEVFSSSLGLPGMRGPAHGARMSTLEEDIHAVQRLATAAGLTVADAAAVERVLASARTNVAAPGCARLSVNVNQETAAALKRASALRSTTITETVRQAISVFAFLADEVAAGRQWETINVDGRRRRKIVLD